MTRNTLDRAGLAIAMAVAGLNLSAMAADFDLRATPAPKGIESIPGHEDARGFLAPAPPEPTLSERFGVHPVNVPRIALEGIDHMGLIAEDEFLNIKGRPARVAVGRPLDITHADGAWHPVEGGMLWMCDVQLTGAHAVRLHFMNVDIPQGAELWVYAPDQPQRQFGPISGLGPLNNGEFWAATAFGDVARIEMFVPTEQIPFALAQSFFRVDRSSHFYKNLAEIVAGNGDDGGIAEGACHNQPVCSSPTYDDLRRCVASIFIEDPPGSGFGGVCSGQLIATIAADQTPYFLTAAHCLNTETDANNTEFFWGFEATTCGGGPTIFGTSNFATLTDTYANADGTLLTVEGELPANRFWSGILTSAVGSGVNLACLHHPDGAYMRISFGNTLGNFGCSGAPANFVEANWTDGVTEPGSSGSGAWRTSDKLLFGTLTCGGSACTAGNPGDADGNGQNDGYGRFALQYSAAGGNFAAFLGSGSDDNLEQNDTCAAAVTITPATYNTRIVKALDEDWYRINIPNGATLSASLSFTDVNGDVDMQLYNSCGGSVVASSTGTSNSEAFNYLNTGASADFFLRVYLKGTDTRNSYNMTIAFAAPTNNNCAAASVASVGSASFSTFAATTDGPTETLCGGGTINNDIWQKIIAPCTGTMTVSLCGATFDTRLAIYSSCPAGPNLAIACNDNFCGSASEVSFPVNSGTLYFIRIGGATTTTGSGTRVISCNVAPPPCPEDITGDNAVGIADLLAVIGEWGCAAGCTADVTGDNTVGIADLLAVIGAWGSCP